MRKDQIFVLMLVILLPLTGCFNDIVGDTIAEGDMTDSTSNNESVNQHPIIYGTISTCKGECSSNGQGYYSAVHYNDLLTADPDGNITDFGMDFDNDFEIDWSFPWDWNSSYDERYAEFDYSLIQINPPANPNDSDDHCHSDYFHLISEDNRGLKEIIPMKWTFDWDEDEQICLFGPRN